MNGIFQGMKLVSSRSLPQTNVKREEPKVETKTTHIVASDEGKPKKIRTTKEQRLKELRKAKMTALDMFIESKPTKNKVREYFENRIKELKEDD